jgi:membrane-bound metal-dependent hydrolase YbcI (DUF457 family)
MAQAGIHALIGIGSCRWARHRTWLALGIVLGNVLPDADVLAMAVATIAGWPAERVEGLHRTFTHSLLTAAFVVLMSCVIARARRRPQWKELGIGLGIGILMHIAVDLAIWFRHVAILWPLPVDVNFWRGVDVPGWWTTFELPAEFLCFWLLFFTLHRLARGRGADQDFLPKLQAFAWIQLLLFFALWAVAHAWGENYRIVHGAFYLPSLGLAIGVIIRMRSTLAGAVIGPCTANVRTATNGSPDARGEGL